jgi:hypothetical protein
LLLAFGLIATRDRWRKHAMHAAAVVGSFGLIAAGGRAATGFVSLSSAAGDVNLRSLFFVSMMALICGAFVTFCFLSFVQARRSRPEAALEPATSNSH